MSSYVPLWCKSNFSFLEGASHPDELVDEACRLGLPALALTDRDGVYGVVRAHLKAREVGLKLIIGSEISIDDGSTIILLAQDRAGYANFCRLITKAFGEGREFGWLRGNLRPRAGTGGVVEWRDALRHSRRRRAGGFTFEVQQVTGKYFSRSFVVKTLSWSVIIGTGQGKQAVVG